MKPSLIVYRPGTHPKLRRLWIQTRARRRRGPPQKQRAESTPQTSTKSEATSISTKEKSGTLTSPPGRRVVAGQLLYKGSTPGTPPPQARRRRRSEASPRRGRTWEDLILSAAAVSASTPAPGNQTLDLLGPNLQPTSASQGPAVSAPSRRHSGHRRQRRLLSPPAATELPFFFPLSAVGDRESSRGVLLVGILAVCSSRARTR